MNRNEFVYEYSRSIGKKDNSVVLAIGIALNEVINMTEYSKFNEIKSIKNLSNEEYLNIASMVCAVLYLKPEMNEYEEEAYKIVKEKGKELDSEFTNLIKESASRLQGAMFYQSK